MKKFFLLGLIPFFMCACSDDSASASSSNWKNASSKPVEITMGECNEDKDVEVNDASMDCDCDKCVVNISNVEDYCGVTASVEYRVFRDTLHVRYADVTETAKCTCVADHSIEVGSVDWKEIEYVDFKGRVDFISTASYKCGGSSGLAGRTHSNPIHNVKQ